MFWQKDCIEVEGGIWKDRTVRIRSNRKHNITTCRYVCFKRKLPENIKFTNYWRTTAQTTTLKAAKEQHVFTQWQKIKRGDLGGFVIVFVTLIEMESDLNCIEAVNFIGKKRIQTELPDIQRVEEIFYWKGWKCSGGKNWFCDWNNEWWIN